MASLSRAGLPRLLLGLERDGFSGRLCVKRGVAWRRFAWRSGAPVQTESSQAGDTLIARLCSSEQISESDAERAGAQVESRGVSELAALLALKLVGPRDLLIALSAQIEAGLADCVGWPDADAELEPDDGEAVDSPAVPVDLLRAVGRGMAKHWRPDQVLAELGEHASHYPRAGEAIDALRRRLPDPAGAAALLEALDGRTGAWQLVRDAASGAALWLLDAGGGLEWSIEPEASEEPPTEDPLMPEADIEIVVAAAAKAGPAAGSDAGDSAGAVAALDAKAEALREEILELHERLSETTLYELLGVDPAAAPAQVKKAYLKAAKRLHPDKVARMGLEEIKEQANDLFAQVTRAHTVLSDMDQRRDYDASLAGHTSVDANQVAQAEALFRKGEVMMKAGSFLGALEFLEGAVNLWPEEMDYQAALAWTLYRKTPSEPERAREHFEKARTLGSLGSQMLLRMSLVLKETGDEPGATALASQARELDPQVRA